MENEPLKSVREGVFEGDQRFEHESFGKINFARSQTTRTNLFGSSVDHSHTITVQIETAAYERSTLGSDSYYGMKRLIEVELSPNQFANAITNMNSGGVPCTLRWVDGKSMKPVPKMETKRAQAAQEMEVRGRKFVERFKTQKARIDELIAKGRAGKGELAEMGKLMDFFEMELTRNMPFFAQQFDRAMDIVVNEAKGEIEAYVTTTIQTKGIQAINNEGGLSLPSSTDEGTFIQIQE